MQKRIVKQKNIVAKKIANIQKNLAMLVILEHIWTEIAKNRKLGKTTDYYLDEIYLLFQNEHSANRLNTIVRRGRKYGTVFTGISQNVTPILESPVARDMLQNCNFIQILRQAGPDRQGQLTSHLEFVGGKCGVHYQ